MVADSTVTVGWTHTLTTTNSASEAGAAPGNQDIAAMARSQFARVVNGTTSLDESIGDVTITDPEAFTVRYDLADNAWSDGVPLAAADLILAWAEGAVLRASLQIADYDEFDRWIEVQLSHPIDDWQTALNVAVPAHVVGQRALDIEDPMAAKHAVVTAILEHNQADLRAIAKVWNNAFELPDGDGSDIPADLLLSSGPYRIAEIDQSRKNAQSVRLVVNKHYNGEPSPQFETIVLRHMDGSKLLQEIGDSVDIVQLLPIPENFTRVRDLKLVEWGIHLGANEWFGGSARS